MTFPRFLFAPLFLLAAVLPARAQEVASATKAAPAGLPIHWGFVVWICVLLGAAVTALAVEGFLKFRSAALTPSAELARLRELIACGGYAEAWLFCRTQTTPSFLCIVAGAGLERIGQGRDAVEFSIEDASIEQATLLRTLLHYLSAIGVVAPMIGLAGTVMGMIRALGTLSQSGTGDYPSLAGAIGDVLVSTEAGLAVAIPGFAFYYFFKARAQTAILLADRAVFNLFDGIPYEQLAGYHPGHSAAAAAAEGGETV